LSGPLAPMMTLETISLRRHHASAICAIDKPSRSPKLQLFDLFQLRVVEFAAFINMFWSDRGARASGGACPACICRQNALRQRRKHDLPMPSRSQTGSTSFSSRAPSCCNTAGWNNTIQINLSAKASASSICAADHSLTRHKGLCLRNQIVQCAQRSSRARFHPSGGMIQIDVIGCRRLSDKWHCSMMCLRDSPIIGAIAHREINLVAKT
jgi:hypothetical protein